MERLGTLWTHKVLGPRVMVSVLLETDMALESLAAHLTVVLVDAPVTLDMTFVPLFGQEHFPTLRTLVAYAGFRL